MKIIVRLNRLVITILLGSLIILVGCAREASISQTQPPAGPVVVKQSSGAGLLIAECRDKQYIISTADYIVEGIVERVESNWNEDKSAIFTHTNLSIEKYVKGAPLAENELQIVTPGDTVSDITQVVEDQPLFHEGNRVRIYFQEVDGEFHIVCAQFGVGELGLVSSESITPSRNWGEQSNGLRCSIAVEETCWSQGSPALVSVIIENVSESKVELKTIPSFTLNEMQFLCPVDIVRGEYELPSNARSTISLDKDAFIDEKIDISRLKWGMGVSATWPDSSFYIVPSGRYKLRLDIEVAGSGLPEWIRSNEIEVDISK